MNAITNAIIDSRNEVFGYTYETSGTIEIAGAVAANGAPVNVKTYRVSASKANRAKVESAMPTTVRREHNGLTFFILAE